MPQAPSLYKGLPLPPEGDLLEIPTSTKERYTVAPLRLVAEPYSTRTDVATVEIGAGDGGAVGDFPQIITITAASQGETTIVLPMIDEKSGQTMERRVTVLVVDQISPAFKEYISNTLRKTWPSTNIDVIVANGRTVLLSGYVDKAEYVEPIVNFVQSALNGQLRAAGQAQGGGGPAGGIQVVNALKVVGAMQVQVKVVFATVNRTKLRDMGFTWNWQDLSAPLTATLALQLPGAHTADATFPFTVSRAGVYNFQGFFQALQQNGLGKVLVEPTILAYSGTPSFFNSGQQYPIVSPGGTVIGGLGNGGQTGGGSGSVTFVPIGTNLRIVPTVLGNGRIRLEIRPEVSSFVRDVPTPGGGTAPLINQQVTENTVELESGQTLVLAGLIQNSQSVTVSKTPVLGDIPVLGTFFQTKSYNQREDELIIMVTPQFADALNERPCKLPGRESRIPNDIEFFLGSKFEPPCFDDPYVGDWKKGWVAPQVHAPAPDDNWGRPSPEFVYPASGIRQTSYATPAMQPATTPVAPPAPGTSPGWKTAPGAPKPGVTPAPGSAPGGTGGPAPAKSAQRQTRVPVGQAADSRQLPYPEPLPPLGSSLWSKTDGSVKPSGNRTTVVDSAAASDAAGDAPRARTRRTESGRILGVVPRSESTARTPADAASDQTGSIAMPDPPAPERSAESGWKKIRNN